VKPCWLRQLRKALRLADPLVEAPVVPAAAVVVVVVEVVEPDEAELDPQADTASARRRPRVRSAIPFAAFPLVRRLFCVMGSASRSRMIGT
jgi:hypothetical protein